MNCSHCGQPNELGAAFCENCGSPLKRVCSSCGASLKAEARFCNQCGAPAPATRPNRLANMQQNAPPSLQEKLRSAAREMEGERKPVTILFTDIVDSTAIAEKLDPEVWKEIVSGAHQRVSQAVYRYEGTVAQLLGDGVLAFFGAPVTHEDDPLRAVLAALDIQRAIAEYEHQLEGVLDRFQMRIGVNTGTVVVGSVGSDLHLEYLAIGDAVNLAARLQSVAQPGKVLISESTARLVQAAFVLQSLGEIMVKGKTEPVAVYEVKEGKDAIAGQRGFEMLSSPLVGREAELEALQQAFTQLRRGLGQVVTITGEPGIGKSRLVEEAWRLAGQGWTTSQPGDRSKLHWLEGRGLSYGQNLSFWTVRQLLQNDLGLSDGDPEIKQRLALRKRVQDLFGDEAGQVLPYLATLLGVQLEGDLAEQVQILDGETFKHQTLVSITRYFACLAEKRPTVLVFDDLNWTDPSSLKALDGLLPLTDRTPLLILLVSRLEWDHPSWKIKLKVESEFAHRYTGIELKPLQSHEQNQLVDSLLLRDKLLPIVDLPEKVRRRIVERAEGNPLFLEEIVRHLIEQGAIVHNGDSWRAAVDIQEVTIPETLRGVLLARIDRLQDDVRHTLQLASVIGKSFLYRLLEAITESEQQLESHLAQLQRADLVREKARLPELEYMFKHSLTQEAAYHSLLLKQRREFHRQVGQALEKLFAGRKEEYLGLLAHHFDAAGDTERAVTYLTQAGDKARLSDEHIEAVGYYQRAIELLRENGDDARFAQLWLKEGLVHHANFQFEAAHQAYENAFHFTQNTMRLLQAAAPGNWKTLRMCGFPWDFRFDPGKTNNVNDGEVAGWLFSGLARVDEELNVIPDVARSWQVLDGGVRYLFHLRDDVRWTDGTPVTAHDFEWAWKRKLHPSMDRMAAQYLFDVGGAQDYHQGTNPDPESIGISALDNLTLEVHLVNPVAYFPYIVTLPESFPLPRASIERYGENWWLPEHIVSNGAYRLTAASPGSGFTLERNPDYHGEFPGNVHRLEYLFPQQPQEGLRLYQEDRTDILLPFGEYPIPDEIPAEQRHTTRLLRAGGFLMNPMLPPFNDVRMRQALKLSLDKERLFTKYGWEQAYGGIIPPGMPGHSPDLSPRYDPEQAHQLMAEAGYPHGQGLPVLKAAFPEYWGFSISEILEDIFMQWRNELGIRVDLVLNEERDQTSDYPIVISGWIADYPDPDNFLRQSGFIYYLEQMGWEDPEYENMVETAAHLPDRARRMALYRQADRRMVADQALVLPWFYANIERGPLVKPWVKNYQHNLLGAADINNVVIEEHGEAA